MSSAPASLPTATLPDGRAVYCVNPYEVDFSVHEIFSEDLTAHGLDLPADGVYLDVGANIGLFALYLRDRCPQARILAYEPMPAVFAALERNLAAMNPPGEALALGLGRAAAELEFDYFPGVAALSTSNSAVGREMAAGLRQLLGGAQAAAEVEDVLEKTGATELREDTAFLDQLFRVERVRAQVDTLSSQIERLGLERIDLLKIDTEGAEKEILAGIDEAHWPRIRQLMVEVHLGREETDAVEADLRRRGYRTAIGSHPLSQGGAAVYHVYAVRNQ